MSELERLYHKGKTGMIVVLDHVSLGNDNPFSKYPQPAFFTIVEDQTPEERFQGIYLLQDSEGNRIRTQEGESYSNSISSYLIEVSVWKAWKFGQIEQDKAHAARTISTLRDRLGLLTEIVQNQGVRVITEAQAQAAGLSGENPRKVRRVDM